MKVSIVEITKEEAEVIQWWISSTARLPGEKELVKRQPCSKESEHEFVDCTETVQALGQDLFEKKLRGTWRVCKKCGVVEGVKAEKGSFGVEVEAVHEK